MSSDSITQVETFGFERIPDRSRYARPIDLFRLLFGGCNTFSTSVLGSFPVLLGLSFKAGVWSIVLGVVIGSCILAPMSLFGPRNGTSDPVSSGAHFGIHGRIVGSFLALLTSVAFFSLAVWSSGDALVGGANHLVGLPVNRMTLGLRTVVRGAGADRVHLRLSLHAVGEQDRRVGGEPDVRRRHRARSRVLSTRAYAGKVALGAVGFWPAFVGAVLVAMSNPVSFASTLGDWARYIPQNTPKKRTILAVLIAQLATFVPFFFGLGTATIIAQQGAGFHRVE